SRVCQAFFKTFLKVFSRLGFKGIFSARQVSLADSDNTIPHVKGVVKRDFAKNSRKFLAGFCPCKFDVNIDTF
ncbi:MAG: hypothetical protein LIO49_04985, partial [Ruminococcus sp.]|nr:hypothetical protein [Ruminococcus sp.]